MNEDSLKLAKDLAAELSNDVKYASTRIEHVRLVARANEAALLVQKMEETLNVQEDRTGN